MTPGEVSKIFREKARFASCEEIGKLLIRKRWDRASLGIQIWRLKDGERNGTLGKGVGMSETKFISQLCCHLLQPVKRHKKNTLFHDTRHYS